MDTYWSSREPPAIPLLDLHRVSDFDNDDISQLTRNSFDADAGKDHDAYTALASSGFEPEQSSASKLNTNHHASVQEGLSRDSKSAASRIIAAQPSEVFTYARPSKVNTFRAWLWELSAISLSLLLLGVTTGLLTYVNNKSLSQWPLAIGLNTLLAVLISLARASLLFSVMQCLAQLKWNHYKVKHPAEVLDAFDSASRGPVGAVRLIMSLRRSNTAATFGAFIIIVSLAIDPFAQEVVAFPLRLGQVSKAEASLQASQNYNPQGPDAGYFNSTAIRGAIYRGLYALDDPFNLECSTGGCSWEQVATLGACGACFDVSAASNGSCSNETSGNGNCTFTTPSNFVLEAPYTEGYAVTFSATVGRNAYYTPNFTWFDNANISLLATFATAWKAAGIDDIVSVSDYQVSECYLAFCARSYDLVIANGTNVSTSGLRTWLLSAMSPGPTTTIINVSYHISDNKSSPYPFPTPFVVGYYAVNDISEFLATLFTDTFGTLTNGAYAGNAIGDVLNATGNIAQTVTNIANSMTNVIRTGPNATPVAGIAYGQETYIHIKWAWFALPVATAFAALFLQLILLYTTSKAQRSPGSGVPLWKSSSTALLLHRLQGFAPQYMAVNEKDIDELAKGLTIVLDDEPRKELTFKAEKK